MHSPRSWSKIGNWSILFFLLKWTRKMCYMIFLKQKPPLKTIKSVSSKSRKKWDFFKGDSPWFCPKINNFPCFYFTRHRDEIHYAGISEFHLGFQINFSKNNFCEYYFVPQCSFITVVQRTVEKQQLQRRLECQGHPTSIFGKYLFGRRFEI